MVACDGLWDVVQFGELPDLVYTWLRDNPGNREGVARYLAQEAMERGSSDNISIIVIFFRDSISPPQVVDKQADNADTDKDGEDENRKEESEDQEKQNKDADEPSEEKQDPSTDQDDSAVDGAGGGGENTGKKSQGLALQSLDSTSSVDVSSEGLLHLANISSESSTWLEARVSDSDTQRSSEKASQCGEDIAVQTTEVSSSISGADITPTDSCERVRSRRIRAASVSAVNYCFVAMEPSPPAARSHSIQLTKSELAKVSTTSKHSSPRSAQRYSGASGSDILLVSQAANRCLSSRRGRRGRNGRNRRNHKENRRPSKDTVASGIAHRANGTPPRARSHSMTKWRFTERSLSQDLYTRRGSGTVVPGNLTAQRGHGHGSWTVAVEIDAGSAIFEDKLRMDGAWRPK